jgi:type IV secretion system protein VirB10
MMSGDPHGDAPRRPAAKTDPESLVLRARPRPVVRFRRGLIVGVAAAFCASLVGLTWVALAPSSFRLASVDGQAGEPLRKAPAEALADAPASYGDVPRLGPRLPGDLGRPILDHQRSLEGLAVPADGSSPRDAARAAAEAERQRAAAAEQAARTADVVVQLAGGSASGVSRAVQNNEQPQAPEADTAAAAPGATASGQQHKLEFAADGEVNQYGLRQAPSPWALSAGTIIPASLVTGLNSDLPGMVIAQVTQNVSDSATGRTVLIPQGARLIGSYDSAVNYGQRRALLVWRRIVFPDGSSVQLDNMPAADSAGFAGLEDKVDSHGWQLLKGIALSTLLGVGTQLGLGSSESDLVRAVRESAQQNAAQAGDQITSRNLDVEPTLKVRPGWPVRALVHKDLILQPWRGAAAAFEKRD